MNSTQTYIKITLLIINKSLLKKSVNITQVLFFFITNIDKNVLFFFFFFFWKFLLIVESLFFRPVWPTLRVNAVYMFFIDSYEI